MTKKTGIDIIEMMDSFAQSIYDTVKPKSSEQPVVIEEMVNAFKELAAWAVKRNEIINAEQGAGGAIEQYQKGIEGRGDSIRKGSVDAEPATASTGILAQLGTRKKSRRPPRLPSYSEGDGGDSGGAGAEQPPISVNGSVIHSGLDGDVRPNLAENSGSGTV